MSKTTYHSLEVGRLYTKDELNYKIKKAKQQGREEVYKEMLDLCNKTEKPLKELLQQKLKTQKE